MQVALLRAHSAEHLILGVAHRSLPYNDIILLGRQAFPFSLADRQSVHPGSWGPLGGTDGFHCGCPYAGNDFIIPVNGPEVEVSKVAARILEELVRPLRELDVTDTEFACLRAIVFFAPGLSLRSRPAPP